MKYVRATLLFSKKSGRKRSVQSISGTGTDIGKVVCIVQKILFGGSGGIAAFEFGKVNLNLSRRLSNSEYLEELVWLTCGWDESYITFS